MVTTQIAVVIVLSLIITRSLVQYMSVVRKRGKIVTMRDTKLIADTIVEFQNEIATQREVICNLTAMNDELQEKIAKQEQVNQELWAENEDLEKKLEKINQIIDSADIKTWGESSIVIRIREVLE